MILIALLTIVENLMRGTIYLELKGQFSVRVSVSFSGIDPKKTRIIKFCQTRPEKTRSIKSMTWPDPTRSGRVSGRVPVRVKALNGHPNKYHLISHVLTNK